MRSSATKIFVCLLLQFLSISLTNSLSSAASGETNSFLNAAGAPLPQGDGALFGAQTSTRTQQQNISSIKSHAPQTNIYNEPIEFDNTLPKRFLTNLEESRGNLVRILQSPKQGDAKSQLSSSNLYSNENNISQADDTDSLNHETNNPSVSDEDTDQKIKTIANLNAIISNSQSDIQSSNLDNSNSKETNTNQIFKEEADEKEAYSSGDNANSIQKLNQNTLEGVSPELLASFLKLGPRGYRTVSEDSISQSDSITKSNSVVVPSKLTAMNTKLPGKTKLLLLVKGAIQNQNERTNLRDYYKDINARLARDSDPQTRQFARDYEVSLKFIVGREAVSDVNDIEAGQKFGQETTKIDENNNNLNNYDQYTYDHQQSKFESSNHHQNTGLNNIDALGNSKMNSTIFQAKSLVDRAILDEARENGDMIIGDFKDKYENLVLKSLTGLEWYMGLSEGERPDYLLLVDDDVDVRVGDLLHLLKAKEDEQTPSQPGSNPILLCPWKNAKRARVSRRGPWAVPVKSYPGSHWPSYCGGACYLMNYAAAKKIYDSAKNVVALDVPIEDAFITGILRQRAGIELESTRPVCVHNFRKGSVTGQFLQHHQEEDVDHQRKEVLGNKNGVKVVYKKGRRPSPKSAGSNSARNINNNNNFIDNSPEATAQFRQKALAASATLSHLKFRNNDSDLESRESINSPRSPGVTIDIPSNQQTQTTTINDANIWGEKPPNREQNQQKDPHNQFTNEVQFSRSGPSRGLLSIVGRKL